MRFSSLLLLGTVSMFVNTSVYADDIDVYKALIDSSAKPNIMFVLDYSGSMGLDTNGQQASSSGLPSRIDVLKSAVAAVLESNKDRINAGIGSMYDSDPSGVRWPAVDLAADAHLTDPEIPAGQFTNADIISIQMEQRGAGGSTATVNGLAETAAYFRADPVINRDVDPLLVEHHEPDRWQTSGSYQDSYHGGYKYNAVPASYLPRQAYLFDQSTTDQYGTCFGREGGPDYCDGLNTYDCEHKEGDTYWQKATTSEAGVFIAAHEEQYPNYWNCKYPLNYRWSGARYETPITQECQQNFMILVSDGEPTVINNYSNLPPVTGKASIGDCEDLSTSIFGYNAGGRVVGNCGPELVEFMATPGSIPSVPGAVVKTHTIGFTLEGAGKEYLRLLAKKGGGQFFEASNATELAEKLAEAVELSLSGSQNFSELSIDINRDSFSHDNRTFFSFFSPSSGPAWSGNLKGYFLDHTGLLDTNFKQAVVTDEKGAHFADYAQSFWSKEADGDDIDVGGVSGLLQESAADERVLLTYTGGAIPNGGVDLMMDAKNYMAVGNNTINGSLLGPQGVVVRDAALTWIQGAPMGDPLHSKPVMVNYGTNKVLYVMTNQGFIHAIDATRPVHEDGSPDHGGGKELFAFMPGELLQNLPDLYTGKSDEEHIYGLDGGITRWHDDLNNDGIVNNNERLLLVLGMRRGGHYYYALDVSNPERPKLQWRIEGGKGDFSALAQSWSRPALVTVRFDGDKKRVLIFGGGYDADTVDETSDRVASSGNAIYFVDEDGRLIHSVDSSDNPNMIYAIPSDPTVIDSNKDGFADRVYIGDLGGQMWRLDFDDLRNSAVTTTLFADIHADGYQPIFYAPSVASHRRNGKNYLSIAFGTGDRTQPLKITSQNKYYMVWDSDAAMGPPKSDVETVTASYLYDATANDIGSDDVDVKNDAKEALENSNGWFINLDYGEKALSRVVTYDGKFMATTFTPDTSSEASACEFVSSGRFYVMSIIDAQPIEFLDDGTETSKDLDASGRHRDLSTEAIPSSPVLVFPKGENQVQVIVDKDSISLIGQKLETVYWHGK